MVEPRKELIALFDVELGALAEVETFIDANVSDRSIETLRGEMHGIVLWFLGGRATKAFRAIILLCGQGYGTEAVILARTLLEITLSMLFIAEADSEKRAKAYVDHDWKFKERFVRSTGQLPEILSKISPELFAENEEHIKQQAQAAKEEHGFENNTGALCWTGQSVAALGDRFSMSFHTRAFYPMSAQHAHVLAGAASEFVRFVPGGGVGWESGPSVNYVPETAVTACDLMISVLKVLNEQFKFGLDAGISELDTGLAKKLKGRKHA
jgi:hypothetical protein